MADTHRQLSVLSNCTEAVALGENWELWIGDCGIGAGDFARGSIIGTDRANRADFDRFCRAGGNLIGFDSVGLWHSQAHRLVLCL